LALEYTNTNIYVVIQNIEGKVSTGDIGRFCTWASASHLQLMDSRPFIIQETLSALLSTNLLQAQLQ